MQVGTPRTSCILFVFLFASPPQNEELRKVSWDAISEKERGVTEATFILFVYLRLNNTIMTVISHDSEVATPHWVCVWPPLKTKIVALP